MKLRVLALSLFLLTGFSTGQTSNSSIGESPGLVKADSPIYGWDVAWDNAMVAAGFSSPGDVAVERASEVSVAENRNHSQAVSKAITQFNEAAEKANNEDVEDLRQAEQILQNVSERVPEEAGYGIRTALENVGKAKNRVPESLTSDRGGGALPDIKMPDVGGDGDLDVPGETGNRSGEG
jgi:hypothetical protein